MPSSFSARFVTVAFGGAALGLLVGLIGAYVFDAGWNPFLVMAIGIFVGAMGHAFTLVKGEGAGANRPSDREQPPAA
jgi:hypothetical protein